MTLQENVSGIRGESIMSQKKDALKTQIYIIVFHGSNKKCTFGSPFFNLLNLSNFWFLYKLDCSTES